MAGAAFAFVHDWRDLDAVHRHINEAIHEMERARAANHYDMAGHGKKAEDLLRGAERELQQAVAAARAEQSARGRGPGQRAGASTVFSGDPPNALGNGVPLLAGIAGWR